MNDEILTLNPEEKGPKYVITRADLETMMSEGRKYRENAIEHVDHNGNRLTSEESDTYEHAGLQVERFVVDAARRLGIDVDDLL